MNHIILAINYEMQEAYIQLYEELLYVVPKILAALAILLFGWILITFIIKLLNRILVGMRIDKFSEEINKIDILYTNNIQLKLSTITSKIIQSLLLLVVVMAAISVLDMPVLAELLKEFIYFIPNVLVAFLLLFFGIFVAENCRKLVLTTGRSMGMPAAGVLSTFVFYFILINVSILALSQAKINTEFLFQNLSIIIGGIVLAFAIGYGLASKHVASNFLASYHIKDKIKVGHKVKINDVVGTIRKMDNNSIDIDTGESIVMIPMHALLKENVEVYY